MNAKLGVLCLTFVGGCAITVGYTPMNAPPHPLVQKQPQEVELHTVPPTDRPFVDVGVFEASIDTVADNHDKVIARMRVVAARAGCDSLVLDAERPAPTVVGPSVDTLYRATCIVYR